MNTVKSRLHSEIVVTLLNIDHFKKIILPTDIVVNLINLYKDGH